MIKYDERIISGEEKPKQAFKALPNGEYVVRIDEIKTPVEVSIENAKIKLRDASGKIVKGEFETIDKLDFARFDITLTITEGEFAGRKIWSKLSTHPDYMWILKGLLYATGNTNITLSELSALVGTTVKVDTNTTEQSYTKTEIDPTTALETEVQKTASKTFVNKYLKP
jgi:hypothetical protein